ncbi:MAG: hypothetical protein J0L67_02405 [Cytophagales bacterium]|nr:hypothetical protein [Cytophagales bacterium]
MKKFWGTSLILLLLTIINCKEDEPIYPIEPYIEFRDIEVKRENSMDSVIVKFYVRDGDFDLGLTINDIESPYHYAWYYNKVEDKLIPGTYKAEGLDINSLLKFSDRYTPSFDTLPEFVDPYSCINYEVLRNDFGQVIDTVYIKINELPYNFIFDFQVQQDDGSWSTFNFREEFSYPNCGFNLHGRFQLQNFGSDSGSPFYFKMISSQEMLLTFKIGSHFLRILFLNKTVRFRLYIYDRALNKSNVVYTSEVQFQN